MLKISPCTLLAWYERKFVNFVYDVIEHTVYGINRHLVQLGAEILNDLHVI